MDFSNSPFYRSPMTRKAVRVKKAPRNRTLTLKQSDLRLLSKKLLVSKTTKKLSEKDIIDRTLLGDTFKVLDLLPDHFADLIFVDPPYNLTKKFHSTSFKRQSDESYEQWLESWVSKLSRLLKPTGSLYICGDWKSSSAIYTVGKKFFIPRNRITWEREKGRGAQANWKNCSEDIWFFTQSEKYSFNVDAVKLKRRVLAPYTHGNGKPKDWASERDGNFRITHPSNLWNDLTIPFWSMPENTSHPTQKPEKLMAKIILASSREGDVVFDPFLGSGTTSVVAKKLNRRFVGIEKETYYACLCEKRLHLSSEDKRIQGYADGVFWERNSTPSSMT